MQIESLRQTKPPERDLQKPVAVWCTSLPCEASTQPSRYSCFWRLYVTPRVVLWSRNRRARAQAARTAGVGALGDAADGRATVLRIPQTLRNHGIVRVAIYPIDPMPATPNPCYPLFCD